MLGTPLPTMAPSAEHLRWQIDRAQ